MFRTDLLSLSQGRLQASFMFVVFYNLLECETWFLYVNFKLKFVVLWKFTFVFKSYSSRRFVVVNIGLNINYVICNEVLFAFLVLKHFKEKFGFSAFNEGRCIKVDRALRHYHEIDPINIFVVRFDGKLGLIELLLALIKQRVPLNMVNLYVVPGAGTLLS